MMLGIGILVLMLTEQVFHSLNCLSSPLDRVCKGRNGFEIR